MNLTGGGALYSQTPESCLEDLGVNEGVGVNNNTALVILNLFQDLELKQMLDCHSERSEESQNRANLVDNESLNSFSLIEGRGRNCANECERTISGEGLVKESQNQVDMFDLAILRRYTPQNDKLSCPRPTGDGRWQQEDSFSKGAGAKHLRILNSNVILNEVKNSKTKQISTIQPFFGLCPQNDKLSYPRLVGERVPKAGEGLSEEEILRSRVEVLSVTSTTNAQNDISNVILNEVKNRRNKHTCSIQPFFGLCPQNDKISAFTLAEVLVTLGIIGIVAAMTIPSLINKYRAFVLQQQFKKVYAAISIASQKVQFDMGENVRCHYGVTTSSTDCPLFYDALAEQLNVIQICESEALEKGCLPKESYISITDIYYESYPDKSYEECEESMTKNWPRFKKEHLDNSAWVYVLNGGFLFIPYANPDMTAATGVFIFDINGKKRPNKWGHDLFMFEFRKKRIYDSYFVLVPASSIFKEEDWDSAQEFFNKINGNNANYRD